MKKYNHIYNKPIVVPEPWLVYINELLDNFDKELRIKWLPKFFSNIIVSLRFKNKIENIKTSFGSLKVTGDFSDNLQEYIKIAKDKCNDTCELCGNIGDTQTVTIRGWVYTCCKECK